MTSTVLSYIFSLFDEVLTVFIHSLIGIITIVILNSLSGQSLIKHFPEFLFVLSFGACYSISSFSWTFCVGFYALDKVVTSPVLEGVASYIT